MSDPHPTSTPEPPAPPAEAASLELDPERARRIAFWVLGLALALGALLRGYLALTDAGIYWPDEIYQSIEPAHRLVYGFGLVPWEFVSGARSWTLPGLVAGLWEVLKLVGLGAPQHALPAIKLVFALVGVATAYATWRLARACGASPLAAALGAAAFALAAPAIYFAPRAMSETACALPAALGLARALDPTSGHGKRVGGAALLAFSVFLRLQCGVLCVGLLGIFAVRRAWRPLLESTAVFAIGALCFGLLDRLTWGGWFHSAIEYLRFNLVEGKASGFGTASWSYYLRFLFHSMPALAVVAGVLAVIGAWRAKELAVLALLFLALHSWVPHKELRFIFPLLPLGFALAALGVDALSGTARRGAIAALLAFALVSAAEYHTLTFGELGAKDYPAAQSAYDDFGPVNRLLTAAGQRADVCGIYMGLHVAWSGGYSYLGRNVPYYGVAKPGPRGAYNYAIVRAKQARGEVAHDGDWALLKLSDACMRDPAYSDRLP